jgi:sugar lactone lactonase YvrE
MNRCSYRLRFTLVTATSCLLAVGGNFFNVDAFGQTPAITLAPVITTIAGNGTAGSGGDGGPATSAAINGPSATAIDAAGNIYIADAYASRVRKIDTTGTISTIVGNGICNFAGDGGPAKSAMVCQPYGVAVDNAGNVYVADTYNYRIRKINSSGIISTIAGNGTATFSGDGGPSVNAAVNAPSGLTVDAAGNIYIADAGNYRVRKINSSGIISTIAGNGVAGFSGDGGPAVNASFSTTYSVAVDPAGNIYISDIYNGRIRKVNTAGIVSTIGGNGVVGFSGDGGPATSAQISNPYGITVDAAGNIYIADTYNNRVRLITSSSGIISTIAGTGVGGFSGDGGAPTSAQLFDPYGVTVDGMGNIYVADINNQRVRKLQQSILNFGTINVGQSSSPQNLYLKIEHAATITSISIPQSEGAAQEYILGTITGCPVQIGLLANTVCTVPVTFAPAYPGLRGVPIIVTTSLGIFSFSLTGIGSSPQVAISSGIINTVAGNGSGIFSGDGGAATAAGMLTPSGVARDSAGNMYIATYNNRIRKVVPGGTITTVAGNGTTCANPTTPCGDGGAATSASFVQPYNVATDFAGNFYISDTNGFKVRKVDLNGTITTVAGNGTSCANPTTSCGDGGLATSANLGSPYGIAFDGSGNLFIAEETGNRIRKVSPSGVITTIAGSGVAGFSGDGGAATRATLTHPLGLAVDVAGNVYISDAGNQRIRRVDGATGVITTVAGGGSSSTIPVGGAPATSVLLSLPVGVTTDASGSFYIVDFGSDTIDKVDGATGTIRIIAGISGSAGFSGDGGSATNAQLNQPQAIALDSFGQPYIADFTNNRVRQVTVTAAPQSFPATVIGQISSTQIAFVSNIGNADLTVLGVTASTDFLVNPAGTCSGIAILAVGTSCNLSIVFRPLQTGARTGNISVIDRSLNVQSDTQQVPLSGNGLKATTTLSLVISTANTVPFGTPVTLAATVTPYTAGSATATGTVSFYDGATLLVTVPISSTGEADTTNTTFTAASTHSLSAVYTGDGNFSTSTSNLVALTVSPITVVLTTSDNPSNYGQSVTFTATVPNGATGSIQFQSDGVNLGGPVVIGGTVVTLTTAGLLQGSHLITAAYSGNGLFSAASSDHLEQLVNPAILTVTANSSTRTYNQPNAALTYTISGLVPGDTLPASFTGTPILATNATTASSVGSYPIQIVQGSLASLNYTFRFVPGALTVTKATPGAGGVASIVVVSSANPSVWGGPVTLTATLPANATGLVTFMDGAVVLGTDTITNDIASISTQLLSVATHTITAVYAGDTNYNGASSAALGQVVNKSLLAVVPDNIQRIYGQSNPVLTSSFSGFVNGDTPAAVTGAPSLTTTATTTSAVGSYTITATLGALASPTYVFSFVAGTLQITPAMPGVGTTAPVTIASSPNPSTFGAAVTLSATVPGGATGTVNFLDGTTTLGTGTIVAGTASIPTSTLAAGTHSITAIYSGDTNYYGASSNALPQLVNKTTPVVTMASSLNPAILGNAVTLMVTVPAGATGAVNFVDGTTLLGTGTISAGTASFTTSTLTVGTHSMTAVYSGDTNYNGASSVALSQVVNKVATIVTLISSLNPAIFGNAVTLTATVPTGATGTANFLDGTTSLGIVTINTRSPASVTTTTLVAGTHPITAVYSGDANYGGASSAVLSQIVNKSTPGTGGIPPVTGASSQNPAPVGSPVTLTSTVPAGATGTISFFDGATLVGTSTITGGSASITTSALAPGTHVITAAYSGDANFAPSTSAGFPQVIAGSAPDFTLSSTTGSQIIPPGASATYTIVVGSVGGAFTNSVIMSASNLPPGATYTFTPATVTPGSTGANTTFAVSVPKQVAATPPTRGLGPIAFAVLLLPFACLKRYRGSPHRLLLWMLVSLASFGAITGCGAGGYFSQTQQTYTITVTGTSGSLIHNTTVTLTVE